MKERNIACIDGQNLYQWLDWTLDYTRFRVYLRDKYKVEKAYYFLGFREKENDLYEKLQESWFILVFNLKWENLKSNKKGNVDTNLVFHTMKKLIEGEFDRIVLVSWDGDYKMLVDYLVEKGRFKKVIAPNLKFASSLYKDKKNLDRKYFTWLDNPDIKKKLEHKKGQKKGP